MKQRGVAPVPIPGVHRYIDGETVDFPDRNITIKAIAQTTGQPMSKPATAFKKQSILQDINDDVMKELGPVMGDDPIKSTADKYTDNHYAVDLMGFSADKIVAYFTQNDPFPLTNATRGAFGCKQDYLIDPTGFSIQMDVSFTTGYPGCADHAAA